MAVGDDSVGYWDGTPPVGDIVGVTMVGEADPAGEFVGKSDGLDDGIDVDVGDDVAPGYG